MAGYGRTSRRALKCLPEVRESLIAPVDLEDFADNCRTDERVE